MDELEGEIDENYLPSLSSTYPDIEKNKELNKMMREERNRYDVSGVSEIKGESVFEMIKKIPSKTVPDKINKRRLLLEFQSLKKELETVKREAEESRKQIDSLTSALSHVHEPKHYIIAKLRDEEDSRKIAVQRAEVRMWEYE